MYYSPNAKEQSGISVPTLQEAVEQLKPGENRELPPRRLQTDTFTAITPTVVQTETGWMIQPNLQIAAPEYESEEAGFFSSEQCERAIHLLREAGYTVEQTVFNDPTVVSFFSQVIDVSAPQGMVRVALPMGNGLRDVLLSLERDIRKSTGSSLMKGFSPEQIELIELLSRREGGNKWLQLEAYSYGTAGSYDFSGHPDPYQGYVEYIYEMVDGIATALDIAKRAETGKTAMLVMPEPYLTIDTPDSDDLARSIDREFMSNQYRPTRFSFFNQPLEDDIFKRLSIEGNALYRSPHKELTVSAQVDFAPTQAGCMTEEEVELLRTFLRQRGIETTVSDKYFNKGTSGKDRLMTLVNARTGDSILFMNLGYRTAAEVVAAYSQQLLAPAQRNLVQMVTWGNPQHMLDEQKQTLLNDIRYGRLKNSVTLSAPTSIVRASRRHEEEIDTTFNALDNALEGLFYVKRRPKLLTHIPISLR